MTLIRHQQGALVSTAASFVFLAVGAQLQAAPPTYHLDLVSSEVSDVQDINASGVVVGGWNDPVSGDMRGYAAGPAHPYELLPLPPGYTRSWANNINDAGVIVGGASITGYPNEHGDAVAWTPDGEGGYDVELLGTLSGPLWTGSVAKAINNRGDIIGVAIWNDSGFGPPVWFNAPDGILDLGYDASNFPRDINDNGLVVGYAAAPFDIDTMQSVPLPAGQLGSTTVLAANSNDEFAGFARPCTNCYSFAVRYTQPFGWEKIGGTPGTAYDINDHGDTVAEVNGGGGDMLAFVHFSGEGTFDIESLLALEFSGWLLCGSCSGLAINNAGQIAVLATHPQYGLAVLTPIVESCAGDIDGNGSVDFADILSVLSAWGNSGGVEDVDGSGLVDFGDLLLVLSLWGPCA